MKFSSPVIKELKYYVYIYSHPITEEIFYVGKGKGNRIFSHLEDNSESEKVKLLNDIKGQGLKPKMEILINEWENDLILIKADISLIDLTGKYLFLLLMICYILGTPPLID